MTEREQRAAARQFSIDWKDRGYEKGESQVFWMSLLSKVFGISEPDKYMTFEEKVKLDHTSFIDVMIPSTHVMIEQKSIKKDLSAKIRQSDGSMLTPYQQAKRYSAELPYSQRPRWIVICNFAEFHIYDMENPSGEPLIVELEDLEKDYHLLKFLVDDTAAKLRREKEVSLAAGDLVGRIYALLQAQYIDPDSESTLHSLNKLCVRLVFCLYAEDAGIFERDAFAHYLQPFRDNPGAARTALLELFKTLDTPDDRRDKYLDPALLAFPYVNGSLFAPDDFTVPRLTSELLGLLIDKASLGFDWSQISPTIFGGLFESTLNPETRRSGGMHYTSIENIHKVIDPLFLNELTEKLNNILSEPRSKKRDRKLNEYRKSLSELTFLDPACGSGNFLTETYISLRRLENLALRAYTTHYTELNLSDEFAPIWVKINQFYGIEINDFAVAVAKTAMWIAESRMMRETEDILSAYFDFLPLKTYANIIEGNALTIDWKEIILPKDLSYIIGNPPFNGARLMSKEQKADLLSVFGSKWKNVGNLDFVAAWYKRCAEYMEGTDIRATLVSTNSICQGEQVASLWKPLIESGIKINFCYRTFVWDSESNQKAHVHCVIVGFSYKDNPGKKRIFDGESFEYVNNINPYLLSGPDICIESRSQPLCPVPKIGIGNKPIDGGNYLFTESEKDEFIKGEPKAAPFFHPWYGAVEFITRNPRFCLWLGECSPAQLKAMPMCLERVDNVRKLRLESSSEGTRKLADIPTRFHVENMPSSSFLLIPRVSSEKREYIPIGFMTPENFTSDAVQIIPDAQLYHFGILTSRIHMAWMRVVAGRLKSDYRYSKDIVYNNFVWPEADEAAVERINATAQAILDARELYPDSSLADLYDRRTMPVELRKAHTANDRAVAKAYSISPDASEEKIVAELMRRYSDKIKN